MFFKVPFERILLMGWLIFCFISNMVAQSKITSILSSPKHGTEINTIDELYRYNYSIYVQPNHVTELIKQYKSTKYENLLNNFILDRNSIGQRILNENITKYRIPFITENDIASFYIRSKKYYNKNNLPMFHLMHESIMPSFQSFQITYGNVFMPIFTKTIRKLNEAGLIDLWANRMFFQAGIEGYLNLHDSFGKEFKPLDLQMTKMAFDVIFFGTMLSSIMLIIEVTFSRILKMLNIKDPI